MISVSYGHTFDSWRKSARDLLVRGAPPEEVDWTDAAAEDSLFASEEPPAAKEEIAAASPWRVPKAFMDLARTAWAHPDARRPAVLYRLLWRLTRGEEKHVLETPTDIDLRQVEVWRKAVSRDIHKMHAFVRFRAAGVDEATGRERYWAWFEPFTRCVRLATPFFVNRFAGMDWSILTPDECAHWDGQNLTFTEGLSRNAARGEDGLDELWRTYYTSIFNPARLMTKAMRAEMPLKYWKNLPESRVIPGLIAESRSRMEEMIETPGREIRPVPKNPYIQSLRERLDDTFLETVPEPADLAELSLEEIHTAASACRSCPLWSGATQTVNGEGPANARVMVVGEQPGDQEDLAGRPFVGPAGQVLRNTMLTAGLDEKAVYLTNAVKHFKWVPSGRKRIHATPERNEVAHCRPWLLAELARVRPEVVVMLGGTAALSLLGREVKVTKERGLVDAPRLAGKVILTYHPSYLLRLPAGAARDRAMEEFREDLTLAAEPRE